MELLDEDVADLDSDITTAIDSISPGPLATISESPTFPLNGAVDTNPSPLESAPGGGTVCEVMPAPSFDPANRPFWIEPPNGTRLQPPETLQTYCTAHELLTSVMYLVASGSAKQHKGYKCGFLDLNTSQSVIPSAERCGLKRILPRISEPPPVFKRVVDAIDMMPKKRGRTPKGFWARSPDGKVHAPQNISLVQFCKMHELNVQCMCQVSEHSATGTY